MVVSRHDRIGNWADRCHYPAGSLANQEQEKQVSTCALKIAIPSDPTATVVLSEGIQLTYDHPQ